MLPSHLSVTPSVSKAVLLFYSLSFPLFSSPVSIMPSSARARSRSLRRLDREEASVVLRCAPPGVGFWLPMLNEELFGVQPSWSDLRLLRARRLEERESDLHRFFDLVVEEDAAARRSAVAAEMEEGDWDIEPLLHLPLLPGRRVGVSGLVTPIRP